MTQQDTPQWMKEKREAAGLTQQQVAEAMGVSLRTVANWEGGSTVPPFGKLARLRRVLEEVEKPLNDLGDKYMKRRIGELVSESTAELGLSRYQLAEKAGVAAGTLYTFEKGKAWPQPARLVKITNALGWKPRAVEKLLTSGKDPAEVTLDDVRESSWAPRRVGAVVDMSMQELLAEVSMRALLMERELEKHRSQDEAIHMFDRDKHAAHPEMPTLREQLDAHDEDDTQE